MKALTDRIKILAPPQPSKQFWLDLASREFRRILIIKPSAVGDVVRTLPVLTALRRRWPQAEISWLVASHCAGVLADHPALDRVIYFDRKGYANVGRDLSIMHGFTSFLHELRSYRFDLVIDLQGLFRSALFAYMTRARVRVGRGDNREMNGFFYTHRAAVNQRNMHAFVLIRSVVAPLGVNAEPSPSDLYIAEHVRSAARQVLEKAGLPAGRPYVVIAPSSNWETKDWPAEKFAQTAALLRKRFDLVPVVVGTKGQRPMAATIRQAEPAAIDLCGASTLAELVAVIQGAALLVANESGPLHIADAFDMPLVGICGPTDPRSVGPYHRTDGVIRADMPCLNCWIKKLRRCPYGHRCMKGLAPEDVVELAGRQLERPAPPRR